MLCSVGVDSVVVDKLCYENMFYPVQYIKVNKELYKLLKKECLEGMGIKVNSYMIRDICGIELVMDKNKEWL